MKHRNIAVLTTALDNEAQAYTLNGIEKHARANNCNVAVFVWFTGTFEKERHNNGEINIINLPDFKLFDGIILLSNTLHIEKNKARILEILEEVDCPVVTIGCKLNGYPQVRTDTYTAMCELVEHYIVDHCMRKIHFVKGIEGNEDAEERYLAYVDTLMKYGIPVLPERISQGDFYVTGGENAAREILNSKIGLPEAIVCANDIMAITICDILQENGHKVPEEIVISGYDYTLEGRYHTPHITTVRCRYHQMGIEACRLVVDMMDGKEVEKIVQLPDEVVLEASCGCYTRREKDPKNKESQYINADILQRIFIHHMITLEKRLLEDCTLEGWINSLSEFIKQINPTEFYCCVNENFVEDIFINGGMEQESMDEEERLAYSDMMNVILAYKNSEVKKKAPFASKYAFDEMFQETETCKTYIFSPLHYQDRNFGYCVFVNSGFPEANQLYVSWLISMGNAIENMRKQSMLTNAMQRLDEMYVRDSLTGAYNRFGMERIFADLKMKCLMKQSKLHISFVDLDDLKGINDEYGHDMGDRMIRATASILIKKGKKSYVVRYGGDEFVIMGIVNSEKEIKAYWDSVDAEVEKYNQKNGRSAQMSFSYGYDMFKIEASTHLEECIKVTDNKMYQVKNQKKLARTAMLKEN